MRKIVVAVVAGAAVLAGSFVLGSADPLDLVTAQEGEGGEIPEAKPDDQSEPAGAPERADVLAEVLSELVDEGVIDQAQADAVAERLRERFAEHRGDRRGHDDRRRPKFADKRAVIGRVAEILDLEPREIADALRSGQSIADVAGDRADEVVAALVGAAEARIDEAVASGRIDAARAAEMKAKVAEKIDEMVHKTRDDHSAATD